MAVEMCLISNKTSYYRLVVFGVNLGFFMNPSGREEGEQSILYVTGLSVAWLGWVRPSQEVEAG